MSLAKPEINTSEPFSEAIGEDRAFRLAGIRIVKAKTADFGEGEMVLIKAAGHDKELGVWGSYLLAQARSATPDDYGKDYKMVRKIIDGFSQRPVKALVPVDESGTEIPF